MSDDMICSVCGATGGCLQPCERYPYSITSGTEDVDTSAIKYLSHTSLGDWDHCEWHFNLKRIQANWPDREFSLPRETGTVFDAMIKHEINKVIKVDDELKDIDSMRTDHRQALDLGSELCQAYVRSGALGYFLDEGVATVGLDIKREVRGVPVYVRLDALMNNGNPADWKVSGAGSVKGTSVRPGWFRRIIWKGYVHEVDMGGHDRQDHNMETINPQWAKQICFYNFGIGREPFEEMEARIEMVACRPGSIQFASYRNRIGMDFQYSLWDRIVEVWKMIQDGDIPLPTYNSYKCHPYGKPCPVSQLCTEYIENAED